MTFERNDEGQGFLSDDFGNSIELSDEQIDAMSDLNGPERLEYIIANLRDPLRSAQQEPAKKKTRDPQLAKEPLEILEAWTKSKGIAKSLGRVNFEVDEVGLDDEEDDEEREIEEDEEDDEI